MSKAHINSKLAVKNLLISTGESTILLDHCVSREAIATNGTYPVPSLDTYYPSTGGTLTFLNGDTETQQISPEGIEIAPSHIGSCYSLSHHAENILSNASFESTAAASVAWDQNLNGPPIRALSWSEGYNGGVGAPTTGYHAHIGVGMGINGGNCLQFMNYNSVINQRGRWLGMFQSFNGPSKGLTFGDWVSVSMYIKTNNVNMNIHFGLYHYDNASASWRFEMRQDNGTYIHGLKYCRATKEGEWQRIYGLFRLPSQASNGINFSQNISLHIYGHDSVNEGRMLVDNVMVCKVPFDEYSPDYYNPSNYGKPYKRFGGGIGYDLLAPPRTIFMHFKCLDKYTRVDRVLMMLEDSSANHAHVYIERNTGLLKLRVKDGTNMYYAELTNNVMDDKWHSIALLNNCIKSGTNKTFKIILDGQHEAELAAYPNTTADILLPKRLGIGFNMDGNCANIKVCEIRCDMVEYSRVEIEQWNIYQNAFYDPYDYNAYVY